MKLSAMKRKLPIPLIAALAVVGAPGLTSLAQESPPAGFRVHAVISAGGNQKTYFLKSARWCGQSDEGWDPISKRIDRVTVSCRR
jgi:hypothetical protein